MISLWKQKLNRIGLFLLIAVAISNIPLFIAIDSPPSEPSIYNTEHWIPLKYTNEPTYTGTSKKKPLPPVSESWKDPTAEIFVGLAHYRDKRCAVTLSNLFEKAEFPNRVHVGIIEQIHTEKDSFSCLIDYCRLKQASIQHNCPYINQIHFIQLTHNDARGPNFARYMQASLRENEEFCMQIDAHSDFIKNWDSLLTNMWGSVQNEYAILSTTPVDVNVLHRENVNSVHQQVPHLCQAEVDEKGMIVSLPPTLAANLPRPVLASLYSAGNAFSKCHALDKVPVDPSLQMVFDADEFSTYARLWTRGYDVYTPNKIVVGHDYYDVLSKGSAGGLQEASVPMEWAARRPGQAQFNRFLYDRSLERISTQLNFPGASRDLSAVLGLTKYGLGAKRTLEQFIGFSGIDVRKKVVFGDRCEELAWVPFIPDADPYTDSSDVWGLAPEVVAAGSGLPLLSTHMESVTIFPIQAYENSYRDILTYTTSTDSSSGGEESSPIHLTSADFRGAVSADAKYLRAKAEKYAQKAHIILEQDIGEIRTIVQHRGKELWWLFQPVDSTLERVMNQLDAEFGVGMGSRVMKVILLLIPLAAVLLTVAYRALHPVSHSARDSNSSSIAVDSSSGSSSLSGLSAALFSSPSAGTRKHTSTGKQH